MKKRLLFFFVGLVCSLGMYAEDETFGITRTIASSETTTNKNTSGAAVTGKLVSDDNIVDNSDYVTVALAHKVESDMTDKARNTYWYNGSSIKCVVDKGTHNYRNSTQTLGDNNYFAFTMTVAEGKALNIKSITGDIMMDGDNTPYQMAIINSEGTEVYTSIQKNCKKSESALKTVPVSDLAEEIQAALTGMTGKVTVKMRWTNTANTGKYCVIKDFNVVAEVTDAAAQTKYSKPSITQGAYDKVNGTYAVTLSTQNDEVGVINYTVGTGSQVTGAASGTIINVAPNTTVKATVSGSAFETSDEATFTTAAAPKLAQPTYTVGAFNFETQKYTVSLAAAEGTIKYAIGSDAYAEYTEALVVAAGTVIKAKAEMANMTASDEITITAPAAPADGESTTPTTANTYSDNMVYNAGAFTIPVPSSNEKYIGGQVSSGNSSINGAIKMRLSRNADPAGSQNGKYGFHILVNPGYTLSEVSLKMLNNYDTKIALVGVYVDNSTDNSLAAPVALPYASASTVEAVEAVVSGIAAKEKVVFVFDKTEGDTNPNQGQIIVSAKGLVPVFNTNVTADKFATIYYDKELVCPEGTKAYTGTMLGNSTLKLAELEGGIIPANTPAIIAGDGGLFTVGTTNATFTGNNDLWGTATDIATSSIGFATVCVLGYENGKSGFYRFDGPTLAANKAYLLLAATPPAKINIVKEGEATGINTVNAKAKNGVMYNLAGQRVNANAKGLVIVNGKVVNMK